MASSRMTRSAALFVALSVVLVAADDDIQRFPTSRLWEAHSAYTGQNIRTAFSSGGNVFAEYHSKLAKDGLASANPIDTAILNEQRQHEPSQFFPPSPSSPVAVSPALESMLQSEVADSGSPDRSDPVLGRLAALHALVQRKRAAREAHLAGSSGSTSGLLQGGMDSSFSALPAREPSGLSEGRVPWPSAGMQEKPRITWPPSAFETPPNPAVSFTETKAAGQSASWQDSSAMSSGAPPATQGFSESMVDPAEMTDGTLNPDGSRVAGVLSPAPAYAPQPALSNSGSDPIMNNLDSVVNGLKRLHGLRGSGGSPGLQPRPVNAQWPPSLASPPPERLARRSPDLWKSNTAYGETLSERAMRGTTSRLKESIADLSRPKPAPAPQMPAMDTSFAAAAPKPAMDANFAAAINSAIPKPFMDANFASAINAAAPKPTMDANFAAAMNAASPKPIMDANFAAAIDAASPAVDSLTSPYLGSSANLWSAPPANPFASMPMAQVPRVDVPAKPLVSQQPPPQPMFAQPLVSQQSPPQQPMFAPVKPSVPQPPPAPMPPMAAKTFAPVQPQVFNQPQGRSFNAPVPPPAVAARQQIAAAVDPQAFSMGAPMQGRTLDVPSLPAAVQPQPAPQLAAPVMPLPVADQLPPAMQPQAFDMTLPQGRPFDGSIDSDLQHVNQTAMEAENEIARMQQQLSADSHDMNLWNAAPSTTTTTTARPPVAPMDMPANYRAIASRPMDILNPAPRGLGNNSPAPVNVVATSTPVMSRPLATQGQAVATAASPSPQKQIQEAVPQAVLDEEGERIGSTNSEMLKQLQNEVGDFEQRVSAMDAQEASLLQGDDESRQQ